MLTQPFVTMHVPHTLATVTDITGEGNGLRVGLWCGSKRDQQD